MLKSSLHMGHFYFVQGHNYNFFYTRPIEVEDLAHCKALKTSETNIINL